MQQNDISKGYFEASKINSNINSILDDISKKTGFTVGKLLSSSHWWSSSFAGALHYSGFYNGLESVLKVQLVKPSLSEAFMIERFREEKDIEIINKALEKLKIGLKDIDLEFMHGHFSINDLRLSNKEI